MAVITETDLINLFWWGEICASLRAILKVWALKIATTTKRDSILLLTWQSEKTKITQPCSKNYRLKLILTYITRPQQNSSGSFRCEWFFFFFFFVMLAKNQLFSLQFLARDGWVLLYLLLLGPLWPPLLRHPGYGGCRHHLLSGEKLCRHRGRWPSRRVHSRSRDR